MSKKTSHAKGMVPNHTIQYQAKNFRVTLKEVKISFAEIYPLYHAAGIGGAVGLAAALQMDPPDLLAFYLCGVISVARDQDIDVDLGNVKLVWKAVIALVGWGCESEAV
jgi:hypothetical protein